MVGNQEEKGSIWIREEDWITGKIGEFDYCSINLRLSSAQVSTGTIFRILNKLYVLEQTA